MSCFNNFILLTNISLGRILNFNPFLAKSYALRPFILTAEYVGGVCKILPLNLFKIDNIELFAGIISFFLRITPSLSKVVVSIPHRTLNKYVLSIP